MEEEILTAKTATIAQKMAYELGKCGIRARIERLPTALAGQGCGYGLRVSRQQHREAMMCLQAAELLPGKVYVRDFGGFREVSI